MLSIEFDYGWDPKIWSCYQCEDRWKKILNGYASSDPLQRIEKKFMVDQMKGVKTHY